VAEPHEGPGGRPRINVAATSGMDSAAEPLSMPDDDEPLPRKRGGVPEGGANSLAQRDASGEVTETDLKPGERRRGGEDVRE